MNPFVWVDLETTGLSPMVDRILEVGLLITDENLGIKGAFSTVVGPNLSPEERFLLHPTVASMHDKNQLFADMDDLEDLGLDLPLREQVDDILVEFLQLNLPDQCGELTLAGSTVSFDREFMKVHLPKTIDLFTHRNADVSAVREFARRWHPQHDELLKAVPQKKAHRSLDDLDDTLALARFYKDLLITGSG